MIEGIRIPNDLNRAVLYVNVLILIAIFIYSLTASSNNLIPTPLAFVWSSIGGIFSCFAVWGYQVAIYNRFKRDYVGRGEHWENWHFHKGGFADRIDNVSIISVIVFLIFHMVAFALQF